jgi:glycerophosphoryl diester phosphodiesterase
MPAPLAPRSSDNGKFPVTLDRSAFLRPIAHRGLHDAAYGIVENTAPAFEAALAGGFGIECDLRPAADGTPMVFHDLTLDRLTDAGGPIAALDPATLRHLRYRNTDAPILTFGDFLDLVAGRAPVLVEVKSEWEPADPAFLREIAALAARYRGPLALMSFDAAVMTALRALVPDVPRGIVAGGYEGAGWWRDRIGAERAFALRHLLESGPVDPSFYAYDVQALPTPVTRFVREVLRLPLFAWTVRSAEDRRRAAAWADAPIFEGDKRW